MLSGEDTADLTESTIMDSQSLKDMKYSELRQLAKSVGIKANVKKDKLLKALEAHYAAKTKDGDAEAKTSGPCSETDGSAEEGTTSGSDVASPGPRVSQSKVRQLTPKGPAGKRSLSKTPQPAEDKKSKKATPQPAKRKRTNTPQLVQEETDGENTPKRKRRSTYDLEEAKVATPDLAEVAPREAGSPGVSDLMEAMENRRDSADMKASLLSMLDKKVQDKRKEMPQEDKEEEEMVEVAPGTHIPRFVAFLNKKKTETKPITPGNKDWKKIHKKEFSRFDSIDVYLAKKQQRTRSLSRGKAKPSSSATSQADLPSASKVKQTMAETQAAIAKLRNNKTPTTQTKVVKPVQSRASLFSPKPAFKPSVLSTKSMNLNFTTRDSPRSKAPVKPPASTTKKTPAKTSAHNRTVTVERESVAPKSARKSMGAKASGATPFKFTATLNTSTAGTSAKKKFDLQASLARPLTWKPYTGKLKPLEGGNTTTASATKPDVKSRSFMKARDKSRGDVTMNRKTAKNNTQMARRGLAMP